MRQQMRLYTVIASGEVVDLRDDASLDAASSRRATTLRGNR